MASVRWYADCIRNGDDPEAVIEVALAEALSRQQTEWEYGINTGSEYNDSWTYPHAEDLLREMSVNGALGDRGSRIGKRRKAGEWRALDRAELEAAIANVTAS